MVITYTRPQLIHATAKMLVGLGLLLATIGLIKIGFALGQSRRGVETVAVIDRAWTSAQRVGSTATLELHWTDDAGKKRVASGVAVSSGLRAKLVTGRSLQRQTVRIRYQPDSATAAVIVVDDLAENLAEGRVMGVIGFLLATLGSLGVLAHLWWCGRAADALVPGR